MRQVMLVVVLLSLASLASAQPATTRSTNAPAAMRYLGWAKLESSARDQAGREFDVDSLSGITWAGGDDYWTVPDNSDKLVRLRVTMGAEGNVDAHVVGGLTIADDSDHEGIAISSDHKSVWVSEETTPAVHEYSLSDGKLVRTIPTPDVYLHGHTVRNRGFESLSLSPDGKTLWTANEHALTVDGTTQAPAEPFGSTTRVRLQRFALDEKENATPAGQFVYQTAGVHALGGFNSLADLVALPDGRLLALERSGGQSLGGEKSFKTRIFLVTIDGATDVSKPPCDRGLPPTTAPAEQLPRFVHKDLLFEGFVCNDRGENLEGLCLGPVLGEGRWAVLGVVDSTDGPFRISENAVVVFELDLPSTGER